MKKLLAILGVIFIFSITMWGQNEMTSSEKDITFTYQLGTDVSPLFRSLFKPRSDNAGLLNAPYILQFKSIKNNTNNAFRFGIGGDIKREVADDDPEDKLIQSSLRLRMGYEKQKKISDRWQINTGIDLRFSATKFEQTNNSTFNNDSKVFGVSPLIGIQFRLTPHLYLQTEASFNFYHRVSSFESNFDIIFPTQFPVIGGSKSKTTGGYFELPNALLLVVEF